MTFVTVGNATEPFRRLLEAVEALAGADLLPAPVVIQSGNNPGFVSATATTRSFFSMDEFEAHVRRARLVVAHAGAGTVLHALAAGKVPVVMPRRAKYGEHIDDHQAEFVEHLAKLDRVIPAWEPADLPAAMQRALSQSSRPGPGETRDLVRIVGECLQELLA